MLFRSIQRFLVRDPRSDHSRPFSGTLRPESDDNRVKILNVHYCQVLSYLSALLFISTDLIISQMKSFVYYISEHLFCLICNLFSLQASGLFIVCRIDDIAQLQKSIYEKFTIHSTAMCNNLISTYQLSHYARDGNSSHHL